MFAAAACAVAVGCAARQPPVPPKPPAEAADSGVRVTLSWSGAVDLDLYVTDPAQETVYFGNPKSASGGRLEHDVGCPSAPAARSAGDAVESIRWDRPPPGKYRVGVDFMDACGSGTGEIPVRVAVDVDGKRRERVAKVVKDRFEPIFVEFEVPGRALP